VARVFVTQPIAEPELQRLRAAADVEVFPDSSRILPREHLLEAVARCEVLCCLLHDRVDAQVIDAGRSLRLIVTGAVVPANVDVAHATRRGIAVTAIPNLVVETTADLQWALLMAVARRIPEADRKLRQGLFPGSQSLYFAGGEVHGAVLGSVGFGAIGRAVARRAKGFGMRVLYNRRQRLSPAEEAELGVEYRALGELLEESDFVVINASYHPGTHHLIGAAELGRMKPTAYLVNTARGPIVDEAALVEVLRSGRIAGAALDVYEAEPQVHPGLIPLENVVLTPHIGSATRVTRQRIAAVMVDNALAYLGGRPLPNLVNPEALAGGGPAPGEGVR
jgi:glyoxylate reductase